MAAATVTWSRPSRAAEENELMSHPDETAPVAPTQESSGARRGFLGAAAAALALLPLPGLAAAPRPVRKPLRLAALPAPVARPSRVRLRLGPVPGDGRLVTPFNAPGRATAPGDLDERAFSRSPALPRGGDRVLRLARREFGEEVRVAYFADGRLDAPALAEIRRLLRDRHNDQQVRTDPELLDLLWQIQRQLTPKSPIEVVCGYRSPATNAMLRRTSRGVAANSYHMYGRAVDLRIPGVPLGAFHRFALGLEAGGVGYYPRSNFVHVDTGPVRHWGGGIPV